MRSDTRARALGYLRLAVLCLGQQVEKVQSPAGVDDIADTVVLMPIVYNPLIQIQWKVWYWLRMSSPRHRCKPQTEIVHARLHALCAYVCTYA